MFPHDDRKEVQEHRDLIQAKNVTENQYEMGIKRQCIKEK